MLYMLLRAQTAICVCDFRSVAAGDTHTQAVGHAVWEVGSNASMLCEL